MSRAPSHEARTPIRNSAPPTMSAITLRLQRACTLAAKSRDDCPKCALQRKERNGRKNAAHPTEVDAVLTNPGRPLPRSLRSDMEARFGTDFGSVRIHDDAAAARAADAVDAHAFAYGNDIVFAAGRFDPASADGRWLIAHELAHTVQQSGGGSGVQHAGGEGALEREADMAAYAVLAFRPLPPLSTAPAAVARVTGKTGTSKTAAGPLPVATSKHVALDIGDPALHYEVDLLSETGIKGLAEPVVSVEVDKFHLPELKGKRAFDIIKRSPPAPLVHVPKGKRASASLKQVREDTGKLQENWLRRAGWKNDEKNSAWKTAGGDDSFPKVAGVACHMDHIVELQLGGTGNIENIQALDPDPNVKSGGMIRENLAALGFAIAQDPTLALGGETRDLLIRIRFKNVDTIGPAPSATKCQQIEETALAMNKTRALATGRVPLTLELRDGPMAFSVAPKIFAAKIEDDEDNKPARLAYSGLILTKLDAKQGTHHPLHAKIDLTARMPLKPTGANDVQFLAHPTDKPKLKSNTTNIPIELMYLSPGKITKVLATPDGIAWQGEVTPTHKFLPKLTIAYAADHLAITAGLSEKQLKAISPLPGAKVTRADLGIELMPEFKPTGTLAFELSPGGRKVMEADAKFFADGDKLAADGKINLFLPGVKSAEGDIKYRGGEWSMRANVKTGDLNIPYVRGGELTAVYANQKFSADGRVDLALPGGGSGSLGLGYVDGKLQFTGSGSIGHPRLGTIDVKIHDDGETFTADGKATTGIKRLGLGTSIDVKFRQKRSEAEPKLSGRGKITLDKPKLQGTLDVTLQESGRISASGTVSYPVRDDLVVEVGLAIDEHEKVTTTGTAKLTRPINLFPRKGAEHKLKLFDVSVPIPGLSAGVVGLKFGIAAGIEVGYGFGPGQLKDVEVGGKLQPFDPDPDPVLDLKGTVSIDAGAHLGFWLQGALIADAALAKAKGTITASAGVEAKGNVSLVNTAHYEKGKFDLVSTSRASASLDLIMTLKAGIELTTILGDYGPGATWSWTLAEKKVPTGLGFAFEAPVTFSSVRGMTLPTADQIKWEPPQRIDAEDLLRRMFAPSSKAIPDKLGSQV